MRNPPQFPVIIGVTGHRSIAPAAEPRVRDAVDGLLRQWRCHFGPALHVMTALADGADQVAADAARDAGVPIIAVAPFALTPYRATLRHPDRFDDHWSGAALRVILPEVGNGHRTGGYARQYEQLGILLIRRSHLLLGLWDGVTNQETGGTASVIRMRLRGDHGAAAFHDSPMFLNANSYLDETNRGPVLHVYTPRATDAEPFARPAGSCRLLTWPDPERDAAADDDWAETPVSPDHTLSRLSVQEMHDFRRIDELNRAIGRMYGSDQLLFRGQLGNLRISGIPREAIGPAWFLKRLQAAADTAAQTFQFRLLGHFVPANSPLAMMTTLIDRWRTTKRTPQPGAVFIFTAALPLALYLFERYVEAQRENRSAGLPFMALYVALFGGTYAFYWFCVRRRNWQEHFEDYRALAEAMRVQLYWAIAGVPAAVSDHYLRKQSGDLGWIQFALRGPSLWAAAVAAAVDRPRRDIIEPGWFEDQDGFFTQRAELNHRATRRAEVLTIVFTICAILASLILLWLIPDWRAAAGPSPDRGFAQWREALRDDHGWLIVLAATLPGVAALFSVSAKLRNYEPHAHAYALMRRMFRRTRVVTTWPPPSDAVFQDIVREIGREALSENAEWLMEHRHRKIEP